MLRILLFCALLSLPSVAQAAPQTFDEDLAFLRQHTEVVVLGEDAAASASRSFRRGRAASMTSTAGGAGRPELRLDQPRARGLGAAAARTSTRSAERTASGSAPRAGSSRSSSRGRSVRPRALADAAARRHRALGRSTVEGRATCAFRPRRAARQLRGDAVRRRLERRSGCCAREADGPGSAGRSPASSGSSLSSPRTRSSTRARRAWTKDGGPAVDLDPRHVPALAAHDGRDPLPRRGRLARSGPS